jgi:LytS/YehU family sensor histidine kinase
MSLKVKNLMVYALQNSFTKKVSLDTEITFLKDYIDLKLLEFVHKPVKIDFQVNTATNHIQIPPFILFVFVENVFKHGIHKLSKNRWATISIELKENQLHFQTRNPKPIHPIGDTPNTSGHGIRLTRKRLATFYPQAHWLDENTQKEEEHLFEINLIIHLTQ